MGRLAASDRALAPRVLRRPEGVLEALAELEPMSDMGPVR